MMLRAGVDDFGYTLGRFVDCVEATLDQWEATLGVRHGGVTVEKEMGDRLVVTAHRGDGDLVLSYDAARENALLTEMNWNGQTVTSFVDRFGMISFMTGTCR